MTRVPCLAPNRAVESASSGCPGAVDPRRRHSKVARLSWIAAACWVAAAGCGPAREPGGSPPDAPPRFIETGCASWYGAEFAGRRTANGEVYNPRALTAAHRTLPFGSIVQITNLKNGRCVLVRINDRGPFARDRVVDCSEAAARALGFHRKGVAHVGLDWPRREGD